MGIQNQKGMGVVRATVKHKGKFYVSLEIKTAKHHGNSRKCNVIHAPKTKKQSTKRHVPERKIDFEVVWLQKNET